MSELRLLDLDGRVEGPWQVENFLSGLLILSIDRYPDAHIFYYHNFTRPPLWNSVFAVVGVHSSVTA